MWGDLVGDLVHVFVAMRMQSAPAFSRLEADFARRSAASAQSPAFCRATISAKLTE